MGMHFMSSLILAHDVDGKYTPQRHYSSPNHREYLPETKTAAKMLTSAIMLDFHVRTAQWADICLVGGLDARHNEYSTKG